MASSPDSNDQSEIERSFESYKEFFSTLPKEKGWFSEHLYLYQGYWYHLKTGLGTMAVGKHFKARQTDILLSSSPKSGTLWLKAILFAIMNRTRYKITDHPLLTTNPHECVPFLELHLFRKPPFADVDSMLSPRLFGTHIPFPSLPASIESSGSRIIYVCRNPKDVLVSLWYFVSALRDTDLPTFSLDEAFELFCEGKSGYGPFWDHVKEYKQASLENPDRVFFVTYEEMKRDSLECTKKIAEFVGCPFSKEEENDGVVKDIIELCSYDNLRNLEVNKSGPAVTEDPTNAVYFRKGKVGDGENHLTKQMIEYLDKITNEKLFGIFP